ncbi:hypothetical protein DXG03_002381 [Asterophora parasitica]|uniref:Acetyl-coenzyme A carboxylase carboxyl transferase subunit beta domain-containing protein n=1 Tax=Asterophora parasitica TaxID=117018 RepID=A0A9P7G8V7_9AGAR|nr:hypothetical protein DXG03_002381 [Asterophora parasitica]
MPDSPNGSGKTTGDDASSWEYPLSQLKEQQKLIQQPNLEDPGYIRQKASGKLWVRERLTVLLDEDSFAEVGSVTGKPVYDEESGLLVSFAPANSITGFGRINGRKVFVTADDFSVRGGHADGGIQMKAPYGELLARKARVPLVRLLDGSSGGGSVATCLSQLFAAGPPVVKQATFEDLSKEALGGWEIHAQNGTVDNVATSEQDAFNQIAMFLSYLPSSIFALPPVSESADPPTRREEELMSIIPRRRARPYDVRRLIRLIVDANGPVDAPSSSSFFEIGELWGRCIVTGFARLAGRPVGVLTSDCLVNGGAIDALGSQKSARFATLCDHFGFVTGSVAERAATIRHGAAALSALYNGTMPIYTIIIRRAFGVAGGAFSDLEDGAGTRVAWSVLSPLVSFVHLGSPPAPGSNGFFSLQAVR